MAKNLFSRRGPSGQTRSLYDQLRDNQDIDVENEAGLALDEENLTHQFHDDDLDHADGLHDSRVSTGSAARNVRQGQPRRGRQEARTDWDDDGDNEVPASLLLEPVAAPPSTTKSSARRTNAGASKQPPIPGPSNRRTQAQWEAAQAQQRLHQDDDYAAGSVGRPARVPPRTVGTGMNRREKAMFRWANVSNLDIFIKDVYDYYLGAGIWSILLERMLHLLKVAFLAALLTLLTQCVDYRIIRESKSLSQVLIPQCTKNMWGIWSLGLWLSSFYFVWKTIQWILDLPRLLHMRDFYVFLLEIPEEDMQTVSWQDVVARISTLRDQNVKTASNITPSQRRFLAKQLGRHMASQSKERLDAHDIANRLMRQDNYLIALFNKDILNLTVPLPFVHSRQVLSRTLLWTLEFAVLDLVFDQSGQVRQTILKSDHRGQLSRDLRNRFIFAAAMHLVFAPFLTCWLMINFIFTYYNEYKTNTQAFGARKYTPFARWKFREFNELAHLFEERLNMSYPYAKHYIDQFPKVKTEAAAATIRFFSGSVIAVLALVGFWDPEMFVDFEIFPGMNAFAFLAILGSIWAVANGMISEENAVFDPEYAMRNVIEYTHYEPDHWKGRLHSYDVKLEFAEFYKVKALILLEEMLSIMATPLILFISLPKCADQIIDFFREFTIHVDGMGYVCSFAVFDFQKEPRAASRSQSGATTDAREDYYATKHGKMQASVHGFLDNYVYNPRSGLPGHHLLGPAGRHQFHPPPAFPGLNSPTFAADMRSSRIGRSDRPHSRAPPGAGQPKTPRFGPAMPQPSPMASMLLDAHNQPSSSVLASRNTQKARQSRPPYHGGSNIIEESLEDGTDSGGFQQHAGLYDERDVDESVPGLIGESTWEGSPRRGMTRENSAATTTDGEDATGVVNMLKQFQQTHMRRGVL